MMKDIPTKLLILCFLFIMNSISAQNNALQRNKILLISDTHFSDSSSVKEGYAQIKKNIPLLNSFLAEKFNDPFVKEIILLGDIFDDWHCPPENNPLDRTISTEEHLKEIASSENNQATMNLLRQIASSGTVKLTYVSGNHDMLMEGKVLKEIIPNINYEGEVYNLNNGKIIAEHGHRYDIFNARNNFSQSGHSLPLGFYITRAAVNKKLFKKSLPPKQIALVRYTGTVNLISSLLKENSTKTNNVLNDGIIDFPIFIYKLAVWRYWRHWTDMIEMGGIDCFFSPIEFKAIKTMYAFTDDNWDKIKEKDVITDWGKSIWTSSKVTDFYPFAKQQYFENPKLSVKPNIVIFAHTHNAMLKKYSATRVYANTGSWIDNIDKTTYIEIEPICNGYHIRLYNYKENDRLMNEITIYATESNMIL
jgi:UDP-2,3-diacylglucosamine pyrophosphatase LpxH